MSEKRKHEDDVDIYGDLPNFPCVEDTVKKLEEEKALLQEEISRLKEKLKEVTVEKNKLASKNKSLCLNISVLYKTATAEIGRKDRLIAELRKQNDDIVFRRKETKFMKEADSMLGNSGNHWCYQDAVEQNDYPAPEVEQNESDYAAVGNNASHKLTSHESLLLQNGNRVFSRSLNIAPENKLTILGNSSECINYTSADSRNLVPLSNNEPHKDINGKLHHNFMHLSKTCDLFSQTESNRDINKSEHISYLMNRNDTFHSETRSERVHMKTKLSDIGSSKHAMSKGHASRHNSRRVEYEYKSYSKYKHSESNRSVTHSRNVSSEHHSHLERSHVKH